MSTPFPPVQLDGPVALPRCADAPIPADTWVPMGAGMPLAALPAVVICLSCPLRAGCEEYAAEVSASGIYGGNLYRNGVVTVRGEQRLARPLARFNGQATRTADQIGGTL